MSKDQLKAPIVEPERIEGAQTMVEQGGVQGQEQLANRPLKKFSVHFESDQSRLTPLGRRMLDEVVQEMRNDFTLQAEIIGHNDSIGTEEYSTELSQQRARAVSTYLVENGVESSHLRIDWKGESQPIADNRTAEGRALNRRVEVLLHPISRER